jgi:hypothetical protein
MGPRGPPPQHMDCSSSGLSESELLLAVLLPVCMVALIVVAVAVYCIVMSTSLCPGRRGPFGRHAQPDEMTRLQIEAAVADAIARDRRVRGNNSSPGSHAASGGHHKNKKLHARSSSRRHRHSHENADEFKSQQPLSATAHEKFIASSIQQQPQQQQQQHRRPDGDYDAAPNDTAELAIVREEKIAPTTKAIAYDIVQPHQDDPTEESRSGNDSSGSDNN